MAKERLQGGLIILASILLISCGVLVTRTVYTRAEDGCQDKEPCLQSSPFERFEFRRDKSLIIIGDEHKKGVRKHHQIHKLSNEEWQAIIDALGNDLTPNYLEKHDLIIHQTQNGSFTYSYGNDGTYKSKLYAKVHRKGNRGHASTTYFQMAKGQTGTPSIHYESGFATITQLHFIQGKDTAHWKGFEQGAFFNRNPDGSFLVFAIANAAVKGNSKAISKDIRQVRETCAAFMNSTQFTAQSHSQATTNFTSNGESNDMTSSLKMSVKASPKIPSSGEDVGALRNLKGDKSMMIRGIAKGVYPKYGPGDYVVDFNATIAGSIVNSTLVTNTKGHTWINQDVLSPVHSSSLHHLHFLF
ncbi:uncharacterized protein [Palaemon carinicauda]|uniref:uncharacterized protein n=1 Tax=Palaemon carinicauda TaxID=392227 RepID=UPI0035B5F101